MNVKYGQFKRPGMNRDEMSRRMAKSAQDICLTLAIAILSDVFDFDDDDIQKFNDSYIELAESLRIGTDTIEQIQKNIKEFYG